MDIFKEMQNAGARIEHHLTELLVPVNESTQAIIGGYVNLTRVRTVTREDGVWFGIADAYPLLCLCIEDMGAHIKLRQHARNDFAVIYGMQTRDHLDYGAASWKLGYALLHALAYAGRLDGSAHNEWSEPERNPRLCYSLTIGGALITLHQRQVDSFRVTCNSDFRDYQPYALTACELGRMVMHTLSQAGLLDDRINTTRSIDAAFPAR